MTPITQFFFILAAVFLLSFIIWLLKRGTLSVKYSLLWLACGAALLFVAVFPYFIYVLRDILDMVMPSNVVFMLAIGFVMLVVLSLSAGVSELAHKTKRQTQSIALLEIRIRELEEKLETQNKQDTI